MIEITSLIRKDLMKWFAKIHGYGYRCNKCDRNARIIEVSTDKFCFDYVTFRCPGCHQNWGLEFKKKEIRSLLAA